MTMDIQTLARTIAQADFIWELGEHGFMAASPGFVAQQFDPQWERAEVQNKYRYVAEVVMRAYKSGLA